MEKIYNFDLKYTCAARQFKTFPLILNTLYNFGDNLEEMAKQTIYVSRENDGDLSKPAITALLAASAVAGALSNLI